MVVFQSVSSIVFNSSLPPRYRVITCLLSLCLCTQGFAGDFGERGPPGPDGNPVSETAEMTVPLAITSDLCSDNVFFQIRMLCSIELNWRNGMNGIVPKVQSSSFWHSRQAQSNAQGI